MRLPTKLADLLYIGGADMIAGVIFAALWLVLGALLEKPEYGELGYFFGIINVTRTVALLGLRSTTVVYERKNENVFPAALVLVTIASIIGGIIAVVITSNAFVGIMILGHTVFFFLLGGLNAEKKFRRYGMHRIARAIITVVCAIVLYEVLGINGVLIAYSISALLIVKEVKSLIRNRKVDFAVIKSKIQFAVPALFTRVSDSVIWWGDKIVIGLLFGFVFVGNYQIATQYLFLLNSIPVAIGKFLLPYESEGVKNSKIKILSILAALVISVGSYFFAPFAIDVFLPKYQESILPIQIMGFSIIPLTAIAIQNSEYMGKENSKIVLGGMAFQAVIYLVLLVILGFQFGIVGVALGFLVAPILRVILNFFIKNRV